MIMVDKLLEAIQLEPDADIVAIMMDSLCKVLLNTRVASYPDVRGEEGMPGYEARYESSSHMQSFPNSKNL